MEEISNSKEYTKELTKIYDLFNKHFWNNELPEVIITFVPTSKAYGHLTANAVWKSSKDYDAKYELNISAYTISRSPEEIYETILHEQVHLYNKIHNINDTSNGGRYHNKKFKKTAEDHGLDVGDPVPIYGYTDTNLNEKALAYTSKLNQKHFEYHREKPKKSSGNLMRFVCPNCGKAKVYMAKGATAIPVLCGLCNTQLVFSPTK